MKLVSVSPYRAVIKVVEDGKNKKSYLDEDDSDLDDEREHEQDN